MRRPRVRLTVRRAIVVASLAAVLLAVLAGSLLRRRDDRSKLGARTARDEVRARSDEPSVGALDMLSGPQAPALGERRAVEVEGKPLIVDGYAAFPALGDLDGDGRMDLLLGNPQGYLKVYRNLGEPGHPRFTPPIPFKDLCDDERIPTG
jgi:hypothetical protein